MAMRAVLFVAASLTLTACSPGGGGGGDNTTQVTITLGSGSGTGNWSVALSDRITGAPIAGARVQIDNHAAAAATTNAAGVATLANVAAGAHHLLAIAPGYRWHSLVGVQQNTIALAMTPALPPTVGVIDLYGSLTNFTAGAQLDCHLQTATNLYSGSGTVTPTAAPTSFSCRIELPDKAPGATLAGTLTLVERAAAAGSTRASDSYTAPATLAASAAAAPIPTFLPLAFTATKPPPTLLANIAAVAPPMAGMATSLDLYADTALAAPIATNIAIGAIAAVDPFAPAAQHVAVASDLYGQWQQRSLIANGAGGSINSQILLLPQLPTTQTGSPILWTPASALAPPANLHHRLTIADAAAPLWEFDLLPGSGGVNLPTAFPAGAISPLTVGAAYFLRLSASIEPVPASTLFANAALQRTPPLPCEQGATALPAIANYIR